MTSKVSQVINQDINTSWNVIKDYGLHLEKYLPVDVIAKDGLPETGFTREVYTSNIKIVERVQIFESYNYAIPLNDDLTRKALVISLVEHPFAMGKNTIILVSDTRSGTTEISSIYDWHNIKGYNIVNPDLMNQMAKNQLQLLINNLT